MGLEDGMPNPEMWKAGEPENVTHELLWLKRKKYCEIRKPRQYRELNYALK